MSGGGIGGRRQGLGFEKPMLPSGRKARRRRRRRRSRPPQAPPGGGLRRQASPDGHVRRWHWGPPAGPGGADSSCLTQLPTSIFIFPVETGELDARSGGRDGRRTCRPAGPSDCPSVCAVGMAGQLGWEHRLELPNTTVHIHHLNPSRDWRFGCTIGRSGCPSDVPAGRTQRLPVGLCRRHGRAAGLGVPTRTRVAQHNCPHPSFSSQ